jgi:hypothetical protein
LADSGEELWSSGAAAGDWEHPVEKANNKIASAAVPVAALPKLENFPIHRMVAPTSLIGKWQLRYHHAIFRNQQLEILSTGLIV